MDDKLTRRQILTGAIGIGALSLLGEGWQRHVADSHNRKAQPTPTPCPSPPPTPCNNGTDFNIILHGLFLIELGGKKNPAGRPIRLLSPKTDGMGIRHVYRAGSWKNRKFTDFSGDFDSKWTTTNSQPAIDGLPIIHRKTDHIAYDQSEFSIFLPWPIEFKPLRKIPENAAIHTGIDAQWFPLALALRYGVPPLNDAPVQGCDWAKDHNFHIFAEPECKLKCDEAQHHGPEMVNRLHNMFVPAETFSLGQQPGSECKETCPDPCPPAPGVNRDEDKSLGELFPCRALLSEAQMLSVHLPLCASLFVTST